MTDYLFFLLLGSGAGAIIAAFGLGLLITHQGSGVVNFACGAMATWSAYVYVDLRQGAYTFPFPGLPARYHFAGGDVGFRWALLLALLTSIILGRRSTCWSSVRSFGRRRSPRSWPASGWSLSPSR